MANDSSGSEFVSFLADNDAAVDAMMRDAVDNRSASVAPGDAAAKESEVDDADSCGAYNWPLLGLFTIVVAAIGTKKFTHFGR